MKPLRLMRDSAGDASHSFPPTGGLGLNSGLADVHNLAYKLAHVLLGKASDRLLDTYETERRHVALVNSMQSVKNGRKIFKLLKTMGIGDNLEEAKSNLYAALADPEKRGQIDSGVEEQREHFDNVSSSLRRCGVCVTLLISISWNSTLGTCITVRRFLLMLHITQPSSSLEQDSLIVGSKWLTQVFLPSISPM